MPYGLICDKADSSGAPVPVRDGSPEIANLAALLSYLDWSCGLVDEPDELAAIAYGVAERARRSGALHVDVIVNPTHWPSWQGRLGPMIDALDEGFRQGEEDHKTTAVLCVSLKRTQSRSEALEVVDTVLELGHPRVAALSIDGNEAGGSESHNDRFAPAFERARKGGLRLCAHAGESSGAPGVREAIEVLGAERIDHGIRCVEDPAVMAMVASRQVPLDVCPTSNVVLGVVSDMASHPLARLRAAGVPCSVNTDDPLLYGIDLLGEYRTVADSFRWGRSELSEMAKVGIESCFCGQDRKVTLLKQLDAYLAS